MTDNTPRGDAANDARRTDSTTTDRHDRVHDTDARGTREVHDTRDARTDTTASRHDGASAAKVETRKPSTAHDDSRLDGAKASWGAIFAGVATFIALTIVFSLGSAALGLQQAGGLATGLFSLIALVVALAAAGFVAGALAVRSGLVHGFLTWATSLLAVLVLAGWLGTTLLGAVGAAAGTALNQVDIDQQQVQEAAQQQGQQVDEQDQQQAEQQAQETAQQTAEGMWWTFGGALVGAVVAAGCGAVGANMSRRGNRETETHVTTRS